MSTRRAVLTVLLLAVLAAVPAWADSQARIVRLSLVNGAVQIDRAIGQGFEKAIANMPITQGMKLRTEGTARAEVEFENGTTLRLASGASVEFPQLSLRSDGGRISTVRVDSGTVYMDVRHKKEDDFRLQFAGRELPLDHSVHFRMKLSDGEAQIAVFKGELAINGVRQAKIKKNQTVAIDLRDPEKFELAKGISPDESDAWDANRIEYQEYYTASNYGRSPYAYGRSDLNYYGTWGYVSGYGNVWRPFGVGYGWDPFSNGYWSWYPGFGYTFVSGYPWGWTPYRYGSWVFLGGYGWCWRPGAWSNWHTLPPVINPPATFVPPAAPATPGTGTPTTIIVNRGPGRHKLPDPDSERNAGRFVDRVPATGGAAPVARTAPATRAPTAPATAAPSPATRTHGGRMVPGPDGPVMRSPRMRDPDAGFRGGRSADRSMGARPEGIHRGIPASAPGAAPRVSAPAAAPAPRSAAPPPARAPSAPSRGETKSPPK